MRDLTNCLKTDASQNGAWFSNLIRLHEMIAWYIVLSIPTIVVTLAFGFLPWGLATAIATPIVVTLAAGLFPRKSYIRLNVQTALEGLSYGRVTDAQEHISIALREAEEAKSLDRSELENLAMACEKVAASLAKAGQPDLAQSLRDRCAKLTVRSS